MSVFVWTVRKSLFLTCNYCTCLFCYITSPFYLLFLRIWVSLLQQRIKIHPVSFLIVFFSSCFIMLWLFVQLGHHLHWPLTLTVQGCNWQVGTLLPRVCPPPGLTVFCVSFTLCRTPLPDQGQRPKHEQICTCKVTSPGIKAGKCCLHFDRVFLILPASTGLFKPSLWTPV